MEIKGIIKIMKPLQTLNNGTLKQQIVITTNDKYPQNLPVDFFGDKTDFLQQLKENDDVTIFINLKGSEYQNKHYVSLIGWRITKTPLT